MTASEYPVVVTDHAMWRAAERFPRFDTNKDGFLSREEFMTSGGQNPNAK